MTMTTTPESDPRLEAFLRSPLEVFHSVEHRHQVYRDDPFDVEIVHAEARQVFDRLLNRATTPPGVESGRILLLLGESGSGKTHLVRAFRNQVHARGLGFVGYMQMTSTTSNYGRYVLANLIDSLDKPYHEATSPDSGLLRLSNALAALDLDTTLESFLRDEAEPSDADYTDAIHAAADRLVALPALQGIDLDVIRALLLLRRPEPAVKNRVLKYLRCEDLSDADRRVLGGVVPRRNDEDPQAMVETLGRLSWALGHKALVICIDQLEDMFNFAGAEESFRRVMATVCALADRVPSSIVVVCCLEQYYVQYRERLTKAYLDRIETDPAPVTLKGNRTRDEVELMVARRLLHLYESAETLWHPDEPTFPFPDELLDAIGTLRTRDVLEHCRKFRERSSAKGRLVSVADVLMNDGAVKTPGPDSARAKLQIEQEWNDFFAAWDQPAPDDDDELAAILAWGIEAAGEELESGYRFVARAKGTLVEIDVIAPDGGSGDRFLAAICNRPALGGGLSRQVSALVAAAGDARVPVIVRSSEYPKSPTSQVAKQIGKLVASGGRRITLLDSDWRRILALRAFRREHGKRPFFMEWLAEENHLSRMGPLDAMLDLERLERTRPRVAPPAPSAAPAPPAAPPSASAPRPFAEPAPLRATSAPPSAEDDRGPLAIGATNDLLARPIGIDPEDLKQHAAFLGVTGSGKTTLALNVVEQLLLRGVPALLVDRKGDLAGYARKTTWTAPLGDPVLEARRARLRERVDIAVYTPGHPGGRPLRMPLVHEGIASLPPFERDQVAAYAASAIAGMLGYRDRGRDKSLRAILTQAVKVLSAHAPDGEVTIENLIRFVHDRDPVLVNAIGYLDAKLFDRLVPDLQTLALTSEDLFATEGERLDIEALLGLGAHARPGKTRLAVVTTKFLRDTGRVLFWVAQLLMDVLRHASRSPSSALQFVLLVDEADIYLPALSQPATKGPIEDLLKRGRSAGVGVLLATQSPGDLDYRCRDNIRTWFVGKVKEMTALEKLKLMLSEARVDPSAKLAGQKQGEFHLLCDRDVTSFRASRSILRTDQIAESELLALSGRAGA